MVRSLRAKVLESSLRTAVGNQRCIKGSPRKKEDTEFVSIALCANDPVFLDLLNYQLVTSRRRVYSGLMSAQVGTVAELEADL